MGVFLMVACGSSGDDKAKSLITEYLMQHANDPSSVEVVSVDSIRADSVRAVSRPEFRDAQTWNAGRRKL